MDLPVTVQRAVERVGGARRALTLVLGAALIVAILLLSRWASAPEWVPAFSGLPIETVGRVTDRLRDEGISFRLERGGEQVLVPADDLARARVALARDGIGGIGARPGLELFDQPSWGMTDFTQRVNYRRALEGELERTIGRMRGIEAAQVHLAIHETSAFRRAERAPEASVVLKLGLGASPSRETVQGIAQLVANSVDGLTPDRVAVLDDTGRMLSSPHDPASPVGLTNRQFAVQQEVEGYVREKVEELVAQMVGRSNVRVQVSADLSFDQVQRTTEQLDPERQVLSSEQRAEIVPGPEGGAGSSNVAVIYETPRSLETFSRAGASVARLSVAVLVNDRRVVENGVVRYEQRPADELQRIEALVASAAGINPGRGDVVAVVSTPFETQAPPAPVEAPFWYTLLPLARYAVAALGLVAAFVLGLKLVQALHPRPEPEPATALAAAGGATPAIAGATAPAMTTALGDGHTAPTVDTQIRARAIATIEDRPEAAARLIRTWVKEG